ncbi:hypothetical protein D3C73_1473690 [compost metagenome]
MQRQGGAPLLHGIHNHLDRTVQAEREEQGGHYAESDGNHKQRKEDQIQLDELVRDRLDRNDADVGQAGVLSFFVKIVMLILAEMSLRTLKGFRGSQAAFRPG